MLDLRNAAEVLFKNVKKIDTIRCLSKMCFEVLASIFIDF